MLTNARLLSLEKVIGEYQRITICENDKLNKTSNEKDFGDYTTRQSITRIKGEA